MENYRAVKICGITRKSDALFAVQSGADFIGMVMHLKSPRLCPEENLAEINRGLSMRPRVLVFGKDPADYVLQLYRKHYDPLLFLQYPAGGEGFDKIVKECGYEKVIPSFGIQEDFLPEHLNLYKKFYAMVLDTGGVKSGDGITLDGGTGKTFDWNLVTSIKRRYFLAGGLNPQNVTNAVSLLQPYGVDVSGGVEASNGIKDPGKVKEFIQNARI